MLKTALTTSSAAILSLALSYSPALAQTSTGGLDEIIVTAQRKSESIQDAAIAIDAATGEVLERLGVNNAVDLSKVAPSLSVTSGGGANTAYFIRGVGNFTNNGYTNPAIAFNVDGVYIGRPSSTISSFLDLNRVEVLKGPQGTLYGRNSTGGAINVIPNTPVLGESNIKVSAGVGNYSAYDLTGVGNFAVSENTAVRLAATVSERDGYNNDGTNDAEETAVRAQIYTEISDDLNVRLSADYSTSGGAGQGTHVEGYYRFAPFPNGDSLPVRNWAFEPVPAALSDPYTGLHDPAVLNYLGDTIAGAPGHMPYVGYSYPERNDKYFGVNAEINADLGFADLVVIPSYRKSTLDNIFNGPPFKAAINQDTAKQYSVEARLSGEVGSLDWILGAYYFDENVKGQNAFNQFSTVSNNQFDSDVQSTALFARGTYNVTDDFRLVGGIRYTDESRSMDALQSATAVICLEHPVGRAPFCPQVPSLPSELTLDDVLGALDPALFTGPGPRSPLNGDFANGPYFFGPVNYFAPNQFGPGALLAITPTTVKKDGGDEEVTYRLAAEYDLTSENLLYASLETGFRAGGFNLSKGRETYEPEFIDAYTIGSKNRFMNDRLQLNVEGFYWEYEGQQLAALGLDTDGNNAFYTRNVGESSIKGAEVDFQFAATENTLLRGSVQYLDATYDSYNYTQVDLSDEGIDPPNFLTPVNGCSNTQIMLDPNGNAVPYDAALDFVGTTYERAFDVDCSGKQALYAPKWTFTAGVQQTFNLDTFILIGNLDGRYRGEREVGFNYLEGGRADSVFTADAALTLRPRDGNWEINAYVRNLTDEAVKATYQSGAGNVIGSVYEAPRTYGMRIGYTFD